jgi:hypothetical protein
VDIQWNLPQAWPGAHRQELCDLPPLSVSTPGTPILWPYLALADIAGPAADAGDRRAAQTSAQHGNPRRRGRAALHDQLEKSALLLSRVVGTDRRRAALAAVAGHPHVLATHMPAREIAAEMFLSAHTIRTQMKSIYRRLGVDSRIQAVTRARELGLVED